MKKILCSLITILCFNIFGIQAQTTYFSSDRIVRIKGGTMRLYSFDIKEDGADVIFEITPSQIMRQMSSPYLNDTYILPSDGDFPRLYYGGCYINDKLDKYGNTSDYGWNLVNPNKKYYAKIFYEGKFPPGITQINVGNGSWWFKNYTIINPKKDNTPYNTLSLIKSQINSNNDGVCGIYEKIGTNNQYACVKYNNEYVLVFLDKNYGASVGDMAYRLSKTPSGIFKASPTAFTTWTGYVVFDGVSMIMNDGNDKEEKYLKIYPEESPNGIAQAPGQQSQEWTGTGFALKDGYIVTNHHVVDGAKTIYVMGVNGNSNIEYRAKVVGVDRNNDIALIKIDDYRFNGFNRVPYCVRNSVSDVGSDVFVLGYPLTNYMGEEVKLTNGIISSKTGYQGDVSTYQISAPVQPGNSGGPLFDNYGNVIGIVNAGIPGAENVGYAIKTPYLYNLVNSVSSSSIIPQTNSVKPGNLSSVVNQVKDCVFFIKCK